MGSASDGGVTTGGYAVCEVSSQALYIERRNQVTELTAAFGLLLSLRSTWIGV